MRSFKDRVRHAVMFELIGLAIFTPGAALLFEQPLEHMGIVGIISATAATVWNFVFNIGFDRAMMHLRGSVQKTIPIRIAHTALFEAGLIVVLIPFIAWYLGISLMTALAMDIAIVAFYLVYAFFFNIAYDRVFPIGMLPTPQAS
ncbi:PACE efflux transporter [Rhizobium sp. P44RR-XXIV]|uniref:PACE efflux transporter n=1 Tax=Rhizobium sp. P44RR-XXIV TaxID=1921145 RepID=UPI00098437DC|nr:PACE efflux transporter [Rhizobium sp. P44RR-XXIV]TIX90238.1 PACE efflux transporter [Rhizobium sp. P44RR-XXIV]